MTAQYKIPESVLVVIHTAEMEVLLIERADRPGFWQSVTGSKDVENELLLETAVREVAEETGIVVQNLSTPVPAASEFSAVALENLQDWQLSNVYEIYPVWRHRYAPGVTQNTEHVFGLLVPREIPIVLAPREHLNFIWLPHREAADRCFSSSNAEAILQLPMHMKI
ncbi:MAG: dihydroneopterin triphosphate diphosphatase [Burkholderiaceae bacterium]|uniref:dihydroneopterin triphosphate diphosphatase n=1 Tax=Herminiimonas sp. Marseille-P9896 TaxID=2742211 RepID=UPI00158F140D|nr:MULTISPECIES: dihydroneopterin triphosphate diphosphatase [Oxalobacteraceae]MBX9798719.1 dihydroneopterin triphosphate diphosphatase [Burkholderiaceae bacterium]